jgi:hypothetical protein
MYVIYCRDFVNADTPGSAPARSHDLPRISCGNETLRGATWNNFIAEVKKTIAEVIIFVPVETGYARSISLLWKKNSEGALRGQRD